MSSMSNYLENKLIDFLLRGVSFSALSTLYIALCTAAPSDTSTGSTITEVTGGNYARQSFASNTTNWSTTDGNNNATSAGTNGTSTNSVIIPWNNVTWTATVTHVAICDALSGGNVLFYSSVSPSVSVASGDSISFAVGGLSLQVDN